MNMSFGLATTLNTSQKLTPQMQQAIKLLQLSSLELAQEVQIKLDSNPLLERIEEDEYEYDTDDSVNESDTSLTLDSWNQSAGTDSLSADYDGNESKFDDDSDYNDEFSDSLDKLQQASIDDGAIDNYAADGDSLLTRIISITVTMHLQLRILVTAKVMRTLIVIKAALLPLFKTTYAGSLILSDCQKWTP